MAWEVCWYDQNRAYYWKAIPLIPEIENSFSAKDRIFRLVQSTLGLYLLSSTALFLLSFLFESSNRFLSITINLFSILAIWTLFGWTRSRFHREWIHKAREEKWLKLSIDDRVVTAAKYFHYHYFAASIFVSYLMSYAMIAAMFGLDEQRNILALLSILIMLLSGLKKQSSTLKLSLRLLLKLVDQTGRRYSLLIGLLSQFPLAFFPVFLMGLFSPISFLSVVFLLLTIIISVIPLLIISYLETKRVRKVSQNLNSSLKRDDSRHRFTALDYFAKGEVGDVDGKLVLDFLS